MLFLFLIIFALFATYVLTFKDDFKEDDMGILSIFGVIILLIVVLIAILG